MVSTIPISSVRIDDLVVAEVESAQTRLVGERYVDAQNLTGLSIVGFWDRGEFEIGEEDSVVEANSILVLAGSVEQVREFDAEFCEPINESESAPVVIIGGGRVGRATANALSRRGIDYRIVEIAPDRPIKPDKLILGSAADKSVLMKAGMEQAPSVIVTTRDEPG